MVSSCLPPSLSLSLAPSLLQYTLVNEVQQDYGNDYWGASYSHPPRVFISLYLLFCPVYKTANWGKLINNSSDASIFLGMDHFCWCLTFNPCSHDFTFFWFCYSRAFFHPSCRITHLKMLCQIGCFKATNPIGIFNWQAHKETWPYNKLKS